MGIVRESIIESKFYLSLSKLAADCFTVRNSGTSLSMVITGRSCYYCISYSQTICYKLMHQQVSFCIGNWPLAWGNILLHQTLAGGEISCWIKLRQAAGRCYLIVDLVESRKATWFCSDFRIRAFFGHYYGETLFLLAFFHNVTEIMLFQLDSSRIPYEICSSNTP